MKLFTLLLVVALAFLFVGQAQAAEKKIKIGLLFSDFGTEQWKNEDKLLTGLAKKAGADVITQVSRRPKPKPTPKPKECPNGTCSGCDQGQLFGRVCRDGKISGWSCTCPNR
jgi:hypothetical protein